MPRINPAKLAELLEGIHTMIQLCWDLSKNPELTELLEQVKSKLESIIQSVEWLNSEE